MYERQGVPLPRQTLCGWSGMAAESVSLIMAAIKHEAFADGYVQIDETPLKYQDPQREGACGTGYLWVCHNPVRKVSYMQWHTGRGRVPGATGALRVRGLYPMRRLCGL
jgi:hypothetical protein